MSKTKKAILIVFLICFLFNASLALASDSASVDGFLTRKSQIVNQWIDNFEKSFAQFQQKLKYGSGNLFKDLFTGGNYWDKIKKSFDAMLDEQRGKIEEFKKDYDKAVGIREM